MNIWLIILACVAVLASVGLVFELGNLDRANTEISILSNANTEFANNNEVLLRTSNLKSFENKKALDNFLNSAKTYSEFENEGYASKACISLMREAKEAGYWMGMTPINTNESSYWDAIVLDRKGDPDVSWRLWCVAVVGDADIYIIDAKTRENVVFIVTFNGDFAEYNKEITPSTIPFDRIGK